MRASALTELMDQLAEARDALEEAARDSVITREEYRHVDGHLMGAISDAALAEQGQREAISMMRIGETTAWHERQRRSLARVFEPPRAS